jgi:xanthine dehydrogenase accessory factor
MKEILAILNAYEMAEKEGKKSALATVVRVEGSSYRRPGARMLVTDDGQLTGAISGGCLEGDALRKALAAINQRENRLVTYDTTDEDDAKFGVQLGCNGIVHILFEPINSSDLYNPIHLLKALTAERSHAVVVTLFNLKAPMQQGTVFLYRPDREYTDFKNPNLDLSQEAADVFTTGLSIFKTYGPPDGCEAFLEFIPPNLHLVIAGAGNDVQPLVEMAHVLGWKITVVDGRPSHATAARFPKADQVLVLKPDAVFDHVELDGRTVFVMMTHNYNYDLALMEIILEKEFSYLGMLGPKKKLERMLAELAERGFVMNDVMLSKVHGPVGLDIGAETAEEIALAILAEIKTVMSDHSAKFLKNKKASIHDKEIEIDA